ncbi:hypothetical protein HYR99_24850 [Candidatus Poribacteria bacterium]|nr:hypothetical protein [Candidatus Poribacteria bacterium]
MVRKCDLAKVKQVLLERLKDFVPEVRIERIPKTDYLHIFVVSDAFENYSFMQRHNLVGGILEKALTGNPIYPLITTVSPRTKAEFLEDFGGIPAED